MTREKDLLLNAGKVIILANHNRFIEERLDNDELIKNSKTSILALKDYCAQEIDEVFSDYLNQSLINYARELFIETWLQHVYEDENAGTIIEEKRFAIKTFNNSYETI